MADAEHVLPPLDPATYQITRLLDVKDLRGRRFEFEYTWDKRRCCHMLDDLSFDDDNGWMGFVEAKRLATGDTVVFMRRLGGGGGYDGELLVGVWHAPHGRYLSPEVEHGKMVNAVWQAMEGVTAFVVTYYPRQGMAEFVVWCNEFVGFPVFYPFASGMKMRLRMNPLQLAQSISGTVRTFDHHI